MDPVSTMRRIIRSPYTLVMRLVHWLLADGRWFYRGSHRAAAAEPVAVEPVPVEPVLAAEPAVVMSEPADEPPVISDDPADTETTLEFGAALAQEIAMVNVTFTLPAEVGADDVLLCGDFNGWTAAPTPLQRVDDAWQVTLPLEPGNSYRYRYLLDGQRWENAWQADRYEPNPFGSDNSVVIVDQPELELQAA
jgi:hypothetical protein